MNANIMKMQIFHKIKYDLKGHWRSQKVFFVFKNQLFLKYLFCWTLNLNQILYKWLHNKDTFFHNVMFDLKGHIRLNKALYIYIFSSNNSSLKPLLSLYASLSFPSLSFFFSLSHFSSLFLFFQPPPLPSTDTSAFYPPYASLSFLFLSFFSSLSLFP